MTAILGISAYYHDSAAALVIDGQIVAAAQEERFSRLKHDANFPERAVAFCLEYAGRQATDLDYVCFYEKPWRKFERLLETYLAFAPRGLRSFCSAMPLWLSQKLHLSRELRRKLGRQYRRRFIFLEHHQSHAASAFYPSPFEEAAILTMDGVGEWATASYGTGRHNQITLTHELHFPHSLGLLYSAMTYYCGFRVNSGEYKLMGLAPYGTPRFRDILLSHLVDLKADGSLRLDLSYFDYCHGRTMTSRKFHQLFGGPPRRPEGPLTEREMDLAASMQSITDEVVLRTARHLQQVTGMQHLCLAGGVALNGVAVGRLAQEGPFGKIWVQPAAGDAGGALGAALFVWHQLLQSPREPSKPDGMRGSLLGPVYATGDVCRMLDRHQARYHRLNAPQLAETVADLLAEGQVVGWMQGRMEFGPRALGSRSILADPRDPQMTTRLNEKVKRRESFRPFAPAVLQARAAEYFDVPGPAGGGGLLDSPYMTLVVPVARRHLLEPLCDTPGLEQRHAVRSTIPAVTHVDASARVQTVDEQRHPRFFQLLQAFEHRTGCPVLINTSFNIRGEPIVCTPDDAYRCFLTADLDALVIEDVLLLKREQPPFVVEETAARYAVD